MPLVKHINPYIFRGYDLRGEVDQDLNDDVMYTLGRAYATFLWERRISEAAVGRDNRLTSENYSRAFIRGLNEGGINTHDIGLSLSQIVYYSTYYFRTKGSVMVTASHNPKNYNGLKLGTGYSETMVSEDIQYFHQLVTKGHFSEGSGTNDSIDIFPDYLKHLLKHIHLKRSWKIVVDTGNTTSGLFYPTIFREAGCQVVEQYTNLDGNFPLGAPDPTKESVLKRVSKGVKQAQAEIGFAFDADGDRMAVVDENGSVLWMDTIVALLAKDVLDFLPGSPIVYNTLCSRQVTEAIEKAGGKPVMWLTGHSFIKAKVRLENAPFGGELSGHIYITDNFYGHDDGAYACLRLISYLERTHQTLSQAAAKLSQYQSSPEIKFGLADDLKFKFIKNTITPEFKQTWPKAKFIDIDGIRFDLSNQMAILRASQNGPYITLKFEHKTKDGYEILKRQLKTIMSKHSEINWSEGVNTHALD
ncbi:hypothetical protein A2W24_02130 [Microgenomates group bacterium RBG_16_45_19]|nr:MAG: hypothetical protein A2W24_02130 [Microgenomates group bacterium RBG_16_45_19]